MWEAFMCLTGIPTHSKENKIEHNLKLLEIYINTNMFWRFSTNFLKLNNWNKKRKVNLYVMLHAFLQFRNILSLYIALFLLQSRTYYVCNTVWCCCTTTLQLYCCTSIFISRLNWNYHIWLSFLDNAGGLCRNSPVL